MEGERSIWAVLIYISINSFLQIITFVGSRKRHLEFVVVVVGDDPNNNSCCFEQEMV